MRRLRNDSDSAPPDIVIGSWTLYGGSVATKSTDSAARVGRTAQRVADAQLAAGWVERAHAAGIVRAEVRERRAGAASRSASASATTRA